MKKFTITVYADPGHAWGKVKRDVLLELGVEHLVSSYSYQLRDNVYLEEDCDLPVLCQALNERDVRIKFVEKNSSGKSKIRSYQGYQASI